MRGNSLERRVAAWVLTLPGPFIAHTYEQAARQARCLFDPSASQEAFEAALQHWGYALRQTASCFSIVLSDDSSARKAA